MEIKQLGTAKKVIVEKENTTIIEGGGTAEAIQGRIGQLKTQIDSTTSDYDREKLQERLAKIAGGVAQINVGGATEAEVKEVPKARARPRAINDNNVEIKVACFKETILPEWPGHLLPTNFETIMEIKNMDSGEERVLTNDDVSYFWNSTGNQVYEITLPNGEYKLTCRIITQDPWSVIEDKIEKEISIDNFEICGTINIVILEGYKQYPAQCLQCSILVCSLSKNITHDSISRQRQSNVQFLGITT